MKRITLLMTLIALAAGFLLIGCAGKPAGSPANRGKAAAPSVSGKTTPPPTETKSPPVKEEPPVPVFDAEATLNAADKCLQERDYPNALKLYQEIVKNVNKDDELLPSTYYNIACIYSLMKQKEPALENLDKSVQSGYDNNEWMDRDTDLDFLREMPEYKAIVDKIPPIIELKPTEEDEKAQEEALRLIEQYRGLKCIEPPKYKILEPKQFERAFGGSADSIQGFYRWADKTLYLKTGLDPARSKGTRIHETFHAFQDQLYNIGELHKQVKTTDANYALTALIEGDATLTFIECMPESMARMMLFMDAPWRMGGKPRYDNSRQGEAASRKGAFGYSIAANFVLAVKEATGWEGVNSLYTNLPLSTEWVLHPEKCIIPDVTSVPVVVALPDFSGILGEGWQVSQQDTQGEFGLLLNLLTNDKSGPLAENAAAGWGGDSYIMATNQAKMQQFFIQKTVWDSPKDAQEFYDASGLTFGSDTPVEQNANHIKYKNTNGTVDYVSIKGSAVNIVYNIQENLLDKVIPALD